MNTIADRLRYWAQNEEMIDTNFTEHGKDCNAAAKLLSAMRDALEETAVYLEMHAYTGHPVSNKARALLRELDEL
jgi:hypothetical protein